MREAPPGCGEASTGLTGRKQPYIEVARLGTGLYEWPITVHTALGTGHDDELTTQVRLPPDYLGRGAEAGVQRAYWVSV